MATWLLLMYSLGVASCWACAIGCWRRAPDLPLRFATMSVVTVGPMEDGLLVAVPIAIVASELLRKRAGSSPGASWRPCRHQSVLYD